GVAPGSGASQFARTFPIFPMRSSEHVSDLPLSVRIAALAARGRSRSRRTKRFMCSRCELVGAKGFEPSTPCTPCRCATRLRYAPTELGIIPSSIEQLEDALELFAQARGGNGLRNRD